MASCRLVFTLLVLSVIQCYASIEVPVFLWGDLEITSAKANPLKTTTEQEFEQLLTQELKSEPFTVIFAEETLSVEDFSRKDSEGKSSYPYLESNLDNSFYLPSVENALTVLNRFANPDEVDHVKLTENGLSAEIEPKSGKFLFMSLKDAREGESRSELLRRHNDFMERKVAELKEKNPSVIAFYTAHYPSWTVSESHSRVRRQAEADSGVHNYTFDRLKIYVTKINLYNGATVTELSQLTANATNFNETAGILNSTLTFDGNSIVLNFQHKGGYWMLNTVGLQTPNITGEILYPKTEVYALDNWSYRCAENVTFATTVNDTNTFTLELHNMKVQPSFSTNVTEITFGESFNCVGFFSVPIWSGLFVVFILLGITFFGIMMMMDIKTMDRFDDPKGKTITINAQE